MVVSFCVNTVLYGCDTSTYSKGRNGTPADGTDYYPSPIAKVFDIHIYL